MSNFSEQLKNHENIKALPANVQESIVQASTNSRDVLTKMKNPLVFILFVQIVEDVKKGLAANILQPSEVGTFIHAAENFLIEGYLPVYEHHKAVAEVENSLKTGTVNEA
jgi:hypothetical protein